MTIRMLVAYACQEKAHEEVVKFCIQVGGTYNHTRKTVALGKLEWFFFSFQEDRDYLRVAGCVFQNILVSSRVDEGIRERLYSKARSGERFLGLKPQVVFDESTGEIL